MYPRTKTEMNMYALCEDLYSFSYKIKTDFILYKNFRKFLNECRIKFPSYKQVFQEIQKKIIGTPKNLTWDNSWEVFRPDFKPSANIIYDKIVDHFTTMDLKGYRQDERFANLIDDALHCFYGAHCDFFVTIDSRCYDKAKKLYADLKINTVVATPEQFVKQLEL